MKSLDANFGALIPAPIAKVRSKKLEDSSPPDYFAIRPLAGIEVAWGELNYVTDAKGEVDRAASKPLPYPPKEIELFPYVCAAMWGTAGCPGVPRSDAAIEGCRKVVDFMRFWLQEAAAVRDALKA